MLSARALYGNTSESPEELSFNQGDVLTVLQKDINGLSGWWLCFVDGRVGLAPGNRLRVLSHVETEEEKHQPEPSSAKPVNASSVDRSQPAKWSEQNEVYDVPPSARNPSPVLHLSPEDGSGQSSSGKPEVIYEVPPTTYDRPRRVDLVEEDSEYQVPRAVRELCLDGQETPSDLTQKEVEVAGVKSPTNPDGTMGNVRVFVEDEDDASSEESAGKNRGSEVVKLFVSSEPDVKIPSIYDTISKETGGKTESFSRRLSPTFHDQRFVGGQSTTLPRVTETVTGKPGERSKTLDQKTVSFTKELIQNSNSPSLTAGVVNQVVLDQRNSNRDSLLDDYSVPVSYKTLPSTRYRPSSETFNRRTKADFPGNEHQSLKETGKNRRAHSEVRSPGATTHRSRSENRNSANEGSEYHLSFVDTGIYVDCPQDPDSVSDMMESLHQIVRSQAAKIRELCSRFESSCGGYSIKHEADLTQMKRSCLSLRTALKEFADLGTGALANAMQSPTRDLSENILQHLEQLRVFSQDLNSSVDLVINASRGPPAKLRDALNSLSILTQDIVHPLANLTELVAKNSAVIFSPLKALSAPPVLPALMDIRSSSPVPPNQMIALTGGPEFRSLSPNLPCQSMAALPPPEVRPISPNMQHIQNPPQGNLLFQGSVIRDGKTGIIIGSFPQGFDPSPNSFNFHGPSPISSVQVPSPNFQTASPVLSPSLGSNLPVPNYRTASPAPSPLGSNLPVPTISSLLGKPDSTQLLQTRPLPPLPPGDGTILNSDFRSSPTGYSNDPSDWNSVESDYAAIANEAEREVKRNVGVLVGRLTDQSRDPRFLQPEEPSRSPGREPRGLSPQFKERMEALRPATERTMRLSCTGSRNTTSGTSSNEIAGFFNEFLTGIDREIVHFYVDQVKGHCEAVEAATEFFLVAITDGSTTGSDLVALSRRVVLAAHKLLYAGDAVTKKLTRDEELRVQVGLIAGELCSRLKRTVAASKADADAGASLRRQEMVECMIQVKRLSVRLRDLIFVYIFERTG